MRMRLLELVLAVALKASLCVSADAAAANAGADAGADAGPKLEERGLTVRIPFQGGSLTGRSLLGVETFSAIPYAEAPVGPLRLRPPRRLPAGLGDRAAHGPAPACPQMFFSDYKKSLVGAVLADLLRLPLLQPIVGGQEDCLTVTVQRPAGTEASARLPVLFWIYGGAFQLGATNLYDGSTLLRAAVGQDQPFVFVAVNYRVGAFGFLGGREVLRDGSANLGLLDQRMGLEWVADNIEAFGGDSGRVTVWGESAGAISVFNQMLLFGGNATYGGRPLFQAAIMNSGGLLPANGVDCVKAQATFDAVARHAGCDGAPDVLECLRQLPYDDFLDAASSVPGILTYNAMAMPYMPRPDGRVLPDSPEALLKQGRYWAVPTIVGNQEDEGTLFSLLIGRLPSTEALVDRLARDFFLDTSKQDLTDFVELYGDEASDGSPYRTGVFNELYSGYKRAAAVLGDLVFVLTRRIALTIALKDRPRVSAWSYLASYSHNVPFLGTFHGSDVLRLFYDIVPDHATRSCRTYYLNFIHNLDPNKGITTYDWWPPWAADHDLMWFKTRDSNTILKDDFRANASDWLASHMDALNL